MENNKTTLTTTKQTAINLWMATSIAILFYMALHLLMHFTEAHKGNFKDTVESSFWVFSVSNAIFLLLPIILLTGSNSIVAGRIANISGVLIMLFMGGAGVMYGLVLGHSYLFFLSLLIIGTTVYAMIYTTKWMKIQKNPLMDNNAFHD